MQVAVLGSGNGGLAVAYDWADHGHTVRLFDLEDFPAAIADVRERGGIASTGEMQGFAEVAYSGHDPGQALQGAEVVFVVGPAYATEPLVAAVRDHLRPGQRILVCPGSCAGALAARSALGVALGDEQWVVGETSTLPYAVRITGPAEISVFLKLRHGFFVAATPRIETERVVGLLQEVYPAAEAARSVMQTTLQNGNPVIHPSVTLLNAALIERTHGGFLFYEEGVTPAVGRLISAVDDERLAIAAALELPVLSDPAIGVIQGYMQEENYSTGYSTAPGFQGIGAQSQLDNRYLTEDVGYSLIFLTDLARRVNVPTPVMNSVIEISSVLLGVDLRKAAPRTLARLGLENYGVADLMAL